MATDHELARQSEGDAALPPQPNPPLSRAATVLVVIVAVLLVAWFFFAWLAMGQNVVDAAGESVGTAFALLIIVSVVGAVRRARADRRAD